MTTRNSKHRKTTLNLERLERREVMATFGVPWPEPRNLSVSFPSDNASIGAYPNQLREKLDQVAGRQVWQEEVLRAFQTWAVHANINVGLVADRGDDFGAIGLTTNDPRFGEFRVGAFDQGSTLASASPFGTRNGTWSGDILLNTKTNYFLGDWQSTSPITVPAPNANGPAVELYSVLLHETGNALGLADNNTAGAVMNGLYSGPNGRLKASDIAEIRRLYGARIDPFEPRANNTLGSSTPIGYPAGYRGLTPVSRMGSLNSTSDVDVYRFTPLRNQEKVTVRLWAAGISLLKAQLEVLDRNGNKLADVKADSIFNNNLQLEIGSLADHTLLYIRVAKNSQDVFSVGDYRLELDYRPSNLQPSIVPPVYDADADDNDGGTVDFVSVDQLFANIGLIDQEVGSNDTLVTAAALETVPGYLANSRYEVTTSISGQSDRDYWRFRSPAYASPTLTISVDPVGLANPQLEAVVLNSVGDRLAARTTRKPDGGFTMIINNSGANRNLTLMVSNRAGSPIASGNYVVTMDFATDPATEQVEVYRAEVSATAEHVSQLNVTKTQLMRFDLSGFGTSGNNGVQLTIYNARTGDIEGTLAAAVNSTRTAYLWLSEGSYILRATALTRPGTVLRPVSFRLRADVISDDQGPRPLDPTVLPDPVVDSEFIWYPLEQSSPPPIIDYLDPPLESPWDTNAYQEFFADYYDLILA